MGSRVALIGHGHLGKFHAQKAFELKGTDFTCIVDSYKPLDDIDTSSFPHVLKFDNLDQALTHFDAAIVATPTSNHFETCKKLIKNDKHVFCEKPVTEEISQADQLQSMMEEKSLVFQVGQSERFHQVWETIKSEKYQNFFGANSKIKIMRVAPFKGRATDVDVVTDLRIHDVDLICYLTGQTPKSVASRGYKYQTSHWDHVEAEFEFSSGMRAEIIVSRNYFEERRELTCTSDSGIISVDLMNCEFHSVSSDGSRDELLTYEKNDHLLNEQRLFFESIEKSTAPVVTLKEGKIAVELVKGVLSSLETQTQFRYG